MASSARSGCAAVRVSAVASTSPETSITVQNARSAAKRFRIGRHSLRVERLVSDSPPQGAAYFHGQYGREGAIVLAEEFEHLAPTQFFDVTLDECARVEVAIVHQ